MCIYIWERAVNIAWERLMKRSQSCGGEARSGFCAFWLFLRQALILGFDLPLDSPEYTRQPNDSSPKALTLDLLRFGYKFERYRLREISQTEVQA